MLIVKVKSESVEREPLVVNGRKTDEMLPGGLRNLVH